VINLDLLQALSVWASGSPPARESVKMGELLLEQGRQEEVKWLLGFCEERAFAETPEIAARWCLIGGLVVLHDGNPLRAERYFSRAAEQAAQAGCWELRARSLHHSSLAMSRLGRPVSAVRQSLEALRVLPGSADPRVYLDVVRHLADLLRQLKLPEDALRLYEMALDLAADIQPTLVQPMRLQIAVTWDCLGDYLRAKRMNEQLLDTFRKAGNGGRVADVLNNLGIVEKHVGDLEKAQRHWLECLDYRGLHDPKRGFTLTELAEAYLWQGQETTASRLAREAYSVLAADDFATVRERTVAAGILVLLHRDCPKERRRWATALDSLVSAQEDEVARVPLYGRLIDLLYRGGAREEAGRIVQRLCAAASRSGIGLDGMNNSPVDLLAAKLTRLVEAMRGAEAAEGI
jgi:tetratricopeptide (TPR) repeat protein